jgi:Protein of unknown function (DUF669)
MPRLNYTVRESAGFEVWPKGAYNIRILKAESGVSKTGNNPQVIVKMEAIDGAYEAKKKTWWITISEKSGWDLGQLLEAAIPGQYEAVQAEPDSEGNKRISYEFDTDDLVDKIITVDMDVRKDQNGNDQNNMRARAYEVGGVAAAESTNGAEVPKDAPPQERQATERRRASA